MKQVTSFLNSLFGGCLHAGNEELSCIMEHINTRDKTHEKPDNETEIDVGLTKAQCLPLGMILRPLYGALVDTFSRLDSSRKSD